MLRETGRAAVAEFLGTFVLILSGTAVVAQVVLSGCSHGTYLSINIGWGLAVTMAVYVAGECSGGPHDPLPTPGEARLGRVPPRAGPGRSRERPAGGLASSHT